LDKEIGAAAQKKADEKVKREAEKRKKREEELKKIEEERKKREEEERKREREKAEEKVEWEAEKRNKREEKERKESEEDGKTRERERARAREREKETERESKREGKRPRVGDGAESSDDAAQNTGARQETTPNALSPSTCLLDLFKEKGLDETLCKRICHELGATTLHHWSLVEDPEIDHIEKELDLKRIQIKILKMLVEECKKIVEGQPSKAGGGGGSAETAAVSGAREARIGDKRKLEGEDLLNDGKTRENVGGSSRSAHLTTETLKYPVVDHSATLEYPTVDQTTIWAHLEFEDGQIVPLENSVSTSFYIGREPSPHEHHHRFYHEDDILCRRVSRAHCQILRLDTGSFSSYVLSLNIVLLILMKYVN
jgi:hypothetical protein